MTFAGAHWLTGTCQRSHVEVVEIVSRHLHGLPFEAFDWGRWTYTRHTREKVSGAMVLWSPDRATGEVAVNLPGEACELLGTLGLLSLVRELDLKLTRLDLAWDTDTLTPYTVQAAWDAGQAVTHSKWQDWRKNPNGSTFYIGKRGSDPDVRLLRIYDRRGPTRVELELHGKRAQQLWTLLDETDPSHWSQVGMAYLVDFVEFRDRFADKNVGRCPRLDWWEDFVEGALRLSLPIPRKVPTLEAAAAHLEHSVAGVLSTVADATGDPTAYVLGLIDRGRDRRSPRHQALLDVTRSVKANLAPPS